eukprot:144903-Chlamydomonas_euryale.AAC.7
MGHSIRSTCGTGCAAAAVMLAKRKALQDAKPPFFYLKIPALLKHTILCCRTSVITKHGMIMTQYLHHSEKHPGEGPRIACTESL